jgi:hypothetical protein
MIFLSLINTLAQSIAALLIFILGYVALLLSVIAGIVIADLIYKGARVIWSRAKARGGSADAVSAKIVGAAHMVLCQAGIIRRSLTPVRRTGP